MKERPILFSTPMVRATLEGRKTQTRRIMKPQPQKNINFPVVGQYLQKPCPYGVPDDHLWVRETWSPAFKRTKSNSGVIYRADYGFRKDLSEYYINHKWRPSIFMPRWASRITLENTEVRVQRLQDITEEDAKSEGVKDNHGVFHQSIQSQIDNVYRRNFAVLWDEINAKRGFPWDSNPWVWAITFKRVK